MADALRRAWAMELDARTQARIGSLSKEMDEIHHVNLLYWEQGESQPLAAKAEYASRNERLEQIRAALAKLCHGDYAR
ncbi:MAG: hypothetical protein WA474_18875 [Candidatus Sulfotelmatobacter sp.]